MNFKNDKQSLRSNVSGVGLIEVLIALLIFTVGMLGLAAMQLSAKRASYEATQRSIATGLARDIIERMRTNPGQLAAYANSIEVGGTAPSGAKNCSNVTAAAGCSPAELAAYDFQDWYGLVTGASEILNSNSVGGLVNPSVCVSNTLGAVQVVIAWEGVNDLQDPNSAPACGAGKYPVDATGYTEDPADNLRRRLLVLQSFVGS